MRRSRPSTLTLSLMAAFLVAGPIGAQESTTRGFNIGLHAQGSSLQVQDGDRSNAGGGGILLGYGFNRRFQLFLQLDGAEFDVQNTDVDGDWTMGHADVGVRYHFANSLRSWVPYVQAAFSGRAVTVSNGTLNQVAQSEDISILGGAFTAGGGIMLFFKETWAADIQLAWSGGKFTEVEVGNVTTSGLDLDAQSSRFNVGVSWWP